PSTSWDLVHAFGFGSNGAVWYGTVGNGWGLAPDGGKTVTNWELGALGPEWQYVAPNGIATRGDTVYIGTADGIKLSGDRGASWAEITDSAGAATARHLWGRLRSQYVLALVAGLDGSVWAGHLRGLARSTDGGRTWTESAARSTCATPCPRPPASCRSRPGGTLWGGRRGSSPVASTRDSPSSASRTSSDPTPIWRGCGTAGSSAPFSPPISRTSTRRTATA